MKPLRTIAKVDAFPFQLDRTDGILCIGSCFAEEMGAKLAKNKYEVLMNPWGILFNPRSIANALTAFVEGEVGARAPLVEHDGETMSLAHHGAFRAVEREDLVARIGDTTTQAHLFLQRAKCIIITLGTANVFEWRATGAVVANCHRIPQEYFVRRRLTIQEIVADFTGVFQMLFEQDQRIQIIFTVSPVRHVRDGLVSNQRSKASLHLAVGELCESYEQCHYFPAYELLIDDLRDYRFYGDDLIHPGALASEYIWEQFKDACLVQDLALDAVIEKVQRGLEHRAHGANTERHRAFVEGLNLQMAAIEQKHPQINFDAERSMLEDVEPQAGV